MDSLAAWSATSTDRAVLWRWKEVLARRDGDTATAALLDCLDDHDQDVRIAAVEAARRTQRPLCGRRLMNCLGAYSDKVRQAAVATLASRDSPQGLLALSIKVQHVSRLLAQENLDTAEEFTSRYYHRITPAQRLAVRAARAQLTALLADKSA